MFVTEIRDLMYNIATVPLYKGGLALVIVLINTWK